MKCQKCQTRVYVTERVMIDDQCYHTSCYESLSTDVCPLQQTTAPDSNQNEINLNDNKTDKTCDPIIRRRSADQPIGVTTDFKSQPIVGTTPHQSISPKTNRKSLESRTKPEIPAKTFIKTLKSVDNSSHNSSQEVVKPLRRKPKKCSVDNQVSNNCSKDNQMSDKSSEETERSNSSLVDNKRSDMSSEDTERSNTSLVDNKVSDKSSEDTERSNSSFVDNKVSDKSSEDTERSNSSLVDNKRSDKSSEDNELSNSSLVDNKVSNNTSEVIEVSDISLEDNEMLDKSSEDNELSNKTSDDNECRLLANNFEKSVICVDKQTVDEVFNEVFGKSVTISDEISEISAEDSEEESADSGPEVYNSSPFEDRDEDRDETDIPDNKVIPKVAENQYPDDMNPFGDDESEETAEQLSNTSPDKKTDLKIQITRRPSDDLNPFADEDDFDDTTEDNSTPKPKPRQSLNVSTPSSATVPSPTSSLRSRKKRPAPTPPTFAAIGGGIPQVNSSCSLSSSFVALSGDSSRRDSLISSVSSDFGSSVPNSRTPTPLPRHRLQKSAEELSQTPESCDQSLRSIDSDSDLKKTPTSEVKLKKRLAPPIPAVKRKIKGSLPEIEEELNGIGDQLPAIEKRGKELEEILMNRLEDNSEGQAVGVVDKSDTVMHEFISTARERCRLARRQKELMYMKREHKLEEIQADIEYQMRCVISKQAAQKTDDDRKQEEELLQRLVEIIEERNVIIENMVEDENKEVEEYQRLVSKVTPKKASISDQKEGQNKKVDKHSTKHNTIDKNFNKFKDKLKLKDIKEKKKTKKLEKSAEKLSKMAENGEKSTERSDISRAKSSETLKTKTKDNSIKHLTLKSTLKPLKKSLGLKSSSDKKSSEKTSGQTVNGSNPSEKSSGQTVNGSNPSEKSSGQTVNGSNPSISDNLK